MMAGQLIHSIFLTPSKGESAPHRSPLFSPGSAPFVVHAFGVPVWGGPASLGRPRLDGQHLGGSPPEGPRASAVKSRALEEK